MFISFYSNLKFDRTIFLNSDAMQGISIYSANMNNSNQILITNVLFRKQISTTAAILIYLIGGSLSVSKGTFSKVNAELIQATDSKINLATSVFSRISCYKLGYSCLIGAANSSIRIRGCSFQNIESQEIFMKISNSNISINDTTFTSLSGSMAQGYSFWLENCNFYGKNDSFKKFSSSIMMIQSTIANFQFMTFDNSFESTKRILNSHPSINFLKVDSSNLLITRSVFKNNGPNYEGEGGV